jgi:hypothetical protein
MKRELRLRAQRFENNQRRQKNKQYIEMEDHISYLNSKSALTESEEVNTIGTTLKNKFKQNARQRILQYSTLNQHQENTLYQNSYANLLTLCNPSFKPLKYTATH